MGLHNDIRVTVGIWYYYYYFCFIFGFAGGAMYGYVLVLVFTIENSSPAKIVFLLQAEPSSVSQAVDLFVQPLFSSL